MTAKSKNKNTPCIGIIGLGRMMSAILTRLLSEKTITRSQIWVSRHNPIRDRRLARKFGVRFADLSAVCAKSEILFLGVKPGHMASVLTMIKPHFRSQTLWSMAVGLPIRFYQERLGPKTAVIRLMPNLPCEIGFGATTYFASKTVKTPQKRLFAKTLAATGMVSELEQESQMHAAVALAGSGPAFFYAFFTELLAVSKKSGLSNKLADALCRQTFLGAAQLLSSNPKNSASDLIKRIATPGGTTEAGLNGLREKGFAHTIQNCVRAANQRSREIAQS